VRFGISTHLFHDARLTRDHLRLVADAGFETIELFASRAHFDYHDARAIAELKTWLGETNLTLASVHAPIAEGLAGGVWQRPWSNAVSDASQRAIAVRETEIALDVARSLPYQTLVMHVGVPADKAAGGGDNQRDAARRSVEAIAARAVEVGVRPALEVIPNSLSTPDALVRFIEDDLEGGLDVGVCLDLGHAHLMGDVVDAVETLSGYLSATHVHDNRGEADDHLMPFDGSIDWDAALLALQKVGYDGALMFELASSADPAGTVGRARDVCRRMDTLVAFDGHA
jgi:sugar phosphate isomerase/epimerase